MKGKEGKKFVISLISILLMIGFIPCQGYSADVPLMINYQGYLRASTGEPEAGPVTMTFRIINALPTSVNPATLSDVWEQTYYQIQPVEGIVNVLLGDTSIPYTGDGEISDDDLNYENLYLAVAVGDSDANILTPVQKLTSVPYAIKASTAESVINIPANKVDSSAITDNSIQKADLADGAATGAKVSLVVDDDHLTGSFVTEEEPDESNAKLLTLTNKEPGLYLAFGGTKVILPTGTARIGQTFTIKKADEGRNGACTGSNFHCVASSNAVYITRVENYTLVPYTLEYKYSYVTVTYDGVLWRITASNPPADIYAPIPTISSIASTLSNPIEISWNAATEVSLGNVMAPIETNCDKEIVRYTVYWGVRGQPDVLANIGTLAGIQTGLGNNSITPAEGCINVEQTTCSLDISPYTRDEIVINVVAQDYIGNKAVYCDSSTLDEQEPNVVDPEIGTGDVGLPSKQIYVAWTKANDVHDITQTHQDSLEYMIVRGKADVNNNAFVQGDYDSVIVTNINNGNAVAMWSSWKKRTSATPALDVIGDSDADDELETILSFPECDKSYWINVFVRDAAGNNSNYTPKYYYVQCK